MGGHRPRRLRGRQRQRRGVPVSTADYYANAAGPVAPRPVHSALDLSKLEAAGFNMPDWEERLVA